MKRIIQYGFGLIAVAAIIAFFVARARFFDYVFGKLSDWASVTLVFGIAVLAIVIVAREQSKAKKPPFPFCVKCGYELSATPYRCPKCGTILPEKRKKG
jgi:hypothetical protein